MMIRDSNVAKIDRRAREWARANAVDSYRYSAASSWYRSAFDAGVITRDEYHSARLYYGASWDYAGD